MFSPHEITHKCYLVVICHHLYKFEDIEKKSCPMKHSNVLVVQSLPWNLEETPCPQPNEMDEDEEERSVYVSTAVQYGYNFFCGLFKFLFHIALTTMNFFFAYK